jgi:(1->4)-alpha-D-glucan 1-alpha-D-glucosylmutase
MYRPVATYRLQFNGEFGFADAKAIASYLAALGVTDVYASPLLRARRGSTHGYDVVDAAQLNPELGADADFEEMQNELRRLGLGLLLDVVPNHMAASQENAWWISVLENGPQSRFFHYFDIDWVGSKLILPILGRPYGEAVESQEIQLAYDTDGLHFRYFDRRLPLCPESYLTVLRECVGSLPQDGVAVELRELLEPAGMTGLEPSVPNSKFLKEVLARIHEQDETFRDALDAAITRINGVKGNPESFNALDALLDAQWYRLAYWRVASEKINYRRFFDVADLVGVRIENPEVFEARNARLFQMIAEGQISGLRIDHIDGLYDPIGHLRKLQLRIAPADEPFYVVVEKILGSDEPLPPEFAVSGTTGYDFLDALNGVFIDEGGLERLDRFYRAFTGIEESFEDVAYARKKQVIAELFSGEMRALGERLVAVAATDRNARDFAPSELLTALTEITACLGVYRTYIRDFTVSDADREHIRKAIDCARRRAGSVLDAHVLQFLERVLLVAPPSYVTADRDQWLAFVMRWQQFTGRVMAKGVEDTAFYNYNRLVSMNEVGSDPGAAPFDGLERFHQRNERIARDWPDTLNATSTHDTKRSEDARARIDVLSELAPEWEREVRRWSRLAAPLRESEVPDPNVELLIYQNLLGVWPLENEELEGLEARFRQFLEKAAREAKNATSWIALNPEYEGALLAFAGRLFASEEFRASFVRFQKRVAYYGFLNALSQLVLKATAPGVPDFYQGTELWDFSLVDPDNRRPVDFEQRRAMLKKLQAADARGTLDRTTMLRRWIDGRVKMFVTWKALDARVRHAETFRRGAYRAFREAPPQLCAFARGEEIVVAVPRLVSSMVKPQILPTGEVWGDASLPIDGRWRNVFTGEELEGGRLREIFATFPVAILERC